MESVCSSCDSGRYVDKAGSHSCQMCPSGWAALKSGQTVRTLDIAD